MIICLVKKTKYKCCEPLCGNLVGYVQTNINHIVSHIINGKLYGRSLLTSLELKAHVIIVFKTRVGLKAHQQNSCRIPEFALTTSASGAKVQAKNDISRCMSTGFQMR
jgi:hypothetical protein